MKAIVFGSGGQLGRALVATAGADVVLETHGSDTVDITDEAAVRAAVVAAQPDIIFNAAAYTAVDKAETEVERARAVNGTAVGILRRAAEEGSARLVHVSTDFVFDGSASTPYAVDAMPNPLGEYGRSKLVGEQSAGENALIVRTAWVYAPEGANFVRTMLRLMRERDEVRVVADQIGTPTYAPGLASALWDLARAGCTGIYHYTDSGVASWYDFAVAIQEEALACGLLEREASVIPIPTSEFPTPASRPSYSVLDKSKTIAALGRTSPHWRVNLRKMLNEIEKNG